MTIPVLTLHQPWATLWARDIKAAETRSAPPAGLAPAGVRPLPGRRIARGDLLAIHAAASVPRDVERSLRRRDRTSTGVGYRWADRLGYEYSLDGVSRGVKRALPLRSIVGVTRVLDCIPIVAIPEPTEAAVFHVEHRCAIAIYFEPGTETPTRAWHKVGDSFASWTDQLQFGDYRPGRWAILGHRTVPLTTPIAVPGRQGVWRLPDDSPEAAELRRLADRVRSA